MTQYMYSYYTNSTKTNVISVCVWVLPTMYLIVPGPRTNAYCCVESLFHNHMKRFTLWPVQPAISANFPSLLRNEAFCTRKIRRSYRIYNQDAAYLSSVSIGDQAEPSCRWILIACSSQTQHLSVDFTCTPRGYHTPTSDCVGKTHTSFEVASLRFSVKKISIFCANVSVSSLDNQH